MDKNLSKKQQFHEKEQRERQAYGEPLPPYINSAARENMDPASRFPPQAYHTQAPSRSFKITPKSLMSRGFHVLDGNNNAMILYTADPELLSSKMAIKKNFPLETHLAGVEYHAFRRKIDISFHGNTITLPIKSRFNTETTFASPTLQNSTVTWRSENHLKSYDLLCLDGRGVCLARITTPSWSIKQHSMFDIFGDLPSNPVVVDEFVVTGLAVLYHAIRRRRAATNAAVAGGAA